MASQGEMRRQQEEHAEQQQEVQEDEEEEDEEEEEEEEEEEPQLKYQRLGASIPQVLAKDASSCICVTGE